MFTFVLFTTLVWSLLIAWTTATTNGSSSSTSPQGTNLQHQESILSISSMDMNDQLVPINTNWQYEDQSRETDNDNDKIQYSTEVKESTNEGFQPNFNMQEFFSKVPREGRERDMGDETFRTKLYDDQLYECVLLPKVNKYEHSKDLDEASPERVHQLYGIDMQQVERKIANTQSDAPPKLKDFGNFLFLDDNIRPVHHASIGDNSFNKRRISNKSKNARKEMDELFHKLKASLDKLMCYQNEECYGGALGDNNQKLDQFIRHIRMSKKVFDLLEKNRRDVALLEQQQDWLEEQQQHVPIEPMLYSDSNIKSIALRAKNKSKAVVGKYSDRPKLPPADIPSLLTTPPGHRRQRPAAATGLIESIGKNKLTHKLSKRLIGNLFGGGTSTNLFKKPPVSSHMTQNWRPHRPLSHRSSSLSQMADASPLPTWPKPVLIIKEYEEYNE